jgi:hypothetical protein
MKVKITRSLLLICLLSLALYPAMAEVKQGALPLGQKEAVVFRKNYPFLYYCYTTPAIRSVLAKDPVLMQLGISYRKQLQEAIGVKPAAADTFFVIRTLEIPQSDLAVIQARLEQLLAENKGFAAPVNSWLAKAPYYAKEKGAAARAVTIGKAWQQEAWGINYTIGVYGRGKKPNYPVIDSISLDVRHRSYGMMQQMMGRQVLKETDSAGLFFLQPLFAALRLLECNGRYDAADFEPMEKTVNAKAIARIKTMDWKKYAYTHIAVLGAGPDNVEDSLNPVGILRCRLAAIQYFAGRAPFLVLSGGRVHPYKTNYSEAEEMKEYLMAELGVPADAIIMEPHARHTTTNIRNVSRLVATYGIPMDKPGIICTTGEHIGAVLSAKFEKRCINELGYVPYRIGKQLSDTEMEYYPLPVSFIVDVDEPLDP